MWWYRRYYFSIFVITAERLVEVRVLYSLTLLLCDLIDYWLLGLAIRVQFASLLVSLHVVTSSCIITTVDALNLKQLWGFIYTHTHSKIFSMNFIKSEPIPTQNEPIPTFWANTDTKWANTDTRKWANTDTVSQYRHCEPIPTLRNEPIPTLTFYRVLLTDLTVIASAQLPLAAIFSVSVGSFGIMIVGP